MNSAFPENGSDAYPPDLATAVHGRCQELLVGTGIQLTLPDLPQLEQVLIGLFSSEPAARRGTSRDLSIGAGRTR